MNRETFVKFKKIMLVCSKPSQQVEQCLRSAAGEVVRVSDGEDAIRMAQHANFDMAVLVSTGRRMDLAETFFNLRDIRASMPILIVDDRHERQDVSVCEAEIIAHASRNTQALRLKDLAGYLKLRRPGFAMVPKRSAKPAGR